MPPHHTRHREKPAASCPLRAQVKAFYWLKRALWRLKVVWRSPCGVNRVVLTVHRSLPVCPGKQTSSEPVGTSHLCQIRTHTSQQAAPHSITSSARTSS